MRTSARSVAVVLFDEVDLLSVTGFVHVLSVAGRQWNWRPFRVHALAARPGEVSTRHQLGLIAAAPLTACPRPEILFVPGGYGARRVATDPGLREWLTDAARNATHVASNGAGAFPLAAAGLLSGTEVAVPTDLAERLVELDPSAKPVDPPGVHRAGRVWSAALPARSIDLGLELVSAVLGKKQAAIVAHALGYPLPAGDAMEVRLELQPTTEPPRG